MSSYLFWQTVEKHIKEFTLEDIEYINENFSITTKTSLLSYVSQEFNLTNATLNISLLHIAPSIKRQLANLEYKYHDHEFDCLLFAISSYIFSTWNIELHQALGNSPLVTKEGIIDDCGDIDLF